MLFVKQFQDLSLHQKGSSTGGLMVLKCAFVVEKKKAALRSGVQIFGNDWTLVSPREDQFCGYFWN